MKEIEVKIIGINKSQITKLLKKMGAKESFDGVIEGVFLDYTNKKLHKNNELLRLRTAKNKAFLTYKGKLKKGKVKSCEEKEIEVSDFEKTKDLLLSIGFIVQKETMAKHRTSYTLGKTHFEIETSIGKYSFIPPFMEIESTSEKTIYKYAKNLGFKKEDCLNWTGKDVINYYKKK